MSALLQDLRYALRTLTKRPLHALVTTGVLALAIGANTTVFSVFDGFYLRPLPYPHGNRLVMVYDSYPKMGLQDAGTSIPGYVDRRKHVASLKDLAIYATSERALTGNGPPEELQVTRASASLFKVLGIVPRLGRVFAASEAKPGKDRVAILSYRLWQSHFGGREHAVGSKIRLDGQSYTIVGVMPKSFGFPNRGVNLWVPFAFTPSQLTDRQRTFEFSKSIGRLKPGATLARLNRELAATTRRNLQQGHLQGQYIEATGFTGHAESLRELTVGDLRQMLWLLQGIVLAVLLIACANVANLQLARMAARRKELTVRAALGADRARLAWLVLVESLLLAATGAMGGVALAYGGLALVRHLGLDHASQGFVFALDPAVLAFTAGAALVAALLSGLLPLLVLLREDLVRAVHEAGRFAGGGRAALGFRNALVVVQIAAGVALLVGAGLLAKSFYELQQRGPGFDSDHVWTAHFTLPRRRYANADAQRQFEQEALARLRALPGVTAAGLTSWVPFTPAQTTPQGTNQIEGYTPRSAADLPQTQQRTISRGYLPSLGIPVIKGRNFRASETDPVAIIDTVVANKFWPGGDALGHRLRMDGTKGRWYTIIGVVPAIKFVSLAQRPTQGTVYWYYKQRPRRDGAFTLRTSLPEAEITRAATRAIGSIDPNLALYDVENMDARLSRSLAPQRTPMVLTLAFAAVAFTLAIVGIYAVLTWAVTQRFGEIGVRMALGARGHDVVGMILKQGGRLTAIGAVLGIGAALGLGRIVSSLVPGVSAADAGVYAIAVGGLSGAALLASWLPARRAARIDPMRALREE